MTPTTPACTLRRTDSWPSVAPTSCVLSNAQRNRQGAGTELQRQRIRFVFGELTGDDATRRELRLNHRRRQDFAVEHDRHRLANAVAREAAEYVLKLFFYLEVDHPFRAAGALWRRQDSAGRLQAGAGHNSAEGQTVDRVRAAIRQRVLFAFRQHGIFPQVHLFAGDDLGADEAAHLIGQTAEIYKFEQGSLLYGCDCLGRVTHAGQLNQDAVATLHLHGRLAQAERVNPARYVICGFVQIFRREVLRRDIRLQENPQAADQIQPEALGDVQREFVYAVAVCIDFQVFRAFEGARLSAFQRSAGFSLYAFELGRRGDPDAKCAQ